MDVVFINTRQENFKKGIVTLGNSFKNQPLDLAYPAALLEKEGYKVSIIDANLERLTHEETVKRVKNLSPKVVVFNTASLDRWECPLPTIEQPKKLAFLLRKTGFTLVIIGPHGTTSPEWLLRKIPQIDILVRGEPEITVLETINTIFKRRSFEKILGISYCKNSKIFHNPPRPFLENLDSLPFPAYHLLPMEKYGPMENFLGNYQGVAWPFSIMVTSRGCPSQCIYCFKKMYQEKIPYRARSPENVVKEVEFLIKNYKIKAIYFHDLNFCLIKERVEKICQLILAKNLKFSWGCETRFDNVDLPLLSLMKKTGCQFINFGFESGSQKILDRMKKGVKLKTVTKTILACRKAKILAGCFKLSGLPGETLKTFKETLDFMLKNQIPIPYPYPIIPPLPYPGTFLSLEAEKQFKIKIIWDNIVDFAGKVGTDFFEKNSYWDIQRIVYEYKLKQEQKRSFFIPNKHYLRLLLFSFWEKIVGKNFFN